MVPGCQVSRCPPLRYGADLSDIAMRGLVISAPPRRQWSCHSLIPGVGRFACLVELYIAWQISVIFWTYSLGHYFVNNISAEYGVHEAGNVDQWDLMQWLTGQFADKPTRAIEFIKITDLLHYLYAKPNPDPNPNRIKYWQCTKSVIYPKTHLERLYTPNFK